MALIQSYLKPGVTVDEILNPSIGPIVADPTTICLVGPAKGTLSLSEFVTLDDNTPVTLQTNGVLIPTLTVTDDNGTVYSPGTDYSFIQSTSQLSRSMQTGIANGQEVVIYAELTTDGTHTTVLSTVTELATLIGLNAYIPGTNSGTPVSTAGSFSSAGHIDVFSKGIITSSVGSASTFGTTGDLFVAPNVAGFPQVKVNPAATALSNTSKQIVWFVYVDAANLEQFSSVTLSGGTAINLPVGSSQWVFTTAPMVVTPTTPNTVAYYQSTTGTDLDYAVTGVDTSLAIARSAGTTTMAGGQSGNDRIQVTVTYDATPDNYYRPTRLFAQADVEAKYGAPLDGSGNIFSPLSFASSLAFANGAPSVVCQALYHLSSRDTGTGTNVDLSSEISAGGVATTTNANVSPPQSSTTIVANDWADTLISLRDASDINVVVPIIATGTAGATLTSQFDDMNKVILLSVQRHLQVMQAQQQFGVMIAGEDATVSVGGTNAASATILRAHADALAGSHPAEACVLTSPASFQFSNPISGSVVNLGGQYVAACLAGMLANFSVGESLTRKSVASLAGINDFRSEADKDTDAENGLLVVEAKQGIIRVRHAITTGVADANSRELSVVRAKFHMIETLRDSIDSQIIGQIVSDDKASFTVQLLVQNQLQQLIDEGSISAYDTVQVRQLVSDPTAIEVRFSYKPSFPLNYVNIIFSINTATGVIVADATQGV